MKKLFFTFWALITVSLFSVSLVSCGSDDDNTVLPAKSSYKFEYTLSNDFLLLFDVKTVITVGNTTTELKYDKSVSNTFLTTKYTCKSTGVQAFEAEKGTFVSSKTTCTLKSNWKETLASKDLFALHYGYDISAPGRSDADEHTSVLDGVIQTEGCDEVLKDWAAGIADFDYSSK